MLVSTIRLSLRWLQILEYHVIPNEVIYAANFTQGEVLTSVINETLTVQPSSSTLQQPAAVQNVQKSL